METKPDLAIIDYGMGNLRSVERAWQAAGARTRLVHTPEEIGNADALVFPGQGAIVDAMRLLRTTGFDIAIRGWIDDGRPFFGICLGLQALFEYSEEGDCKCLGVFEGDVRRFRLPRDFKVPHMGWNVVNFTRHDAVNAGLDQDESQFYFVHSFYVRPKDASIAWGSTEYGGETFTSAVASGRCYATQFHPEKSQSKGLQLYRNFLACI